MVNKKENGVSLLALVVTIIVLIIIAGAVIANIRGNSGIINQSANADKKKLTSEEKEAVQWAAAQAVADETNKSGVIADKTKIQEKLNTDISSTHSIPFHSLNPSPLEDAAQLPERKRKEATDAYSVYEEIIKDNIEYDYLIQDRYLDRDRIEEILALILETVCTKRRTIRIAGDDHPAELVKAKFMKLNSEHIRFVLDCMQENTTKIRNIKQYMKAALFNAPSTIGSYYTSLVSHDMYGGRTIQSARSKGIPDYTCNEGESL